MVRKRTGNATGRPPARDHAKACADAIRAGADAHTAMREHFREHCGGKVEPDFAGNAAHRFRDFCRHVLDELEARGSLRTIFLTLAPVMENRRRQVLGPLRDGAHLLRKMMRDAGL